MESLNVWLLLFKIVPVRCILIVAKNSSLLWLLYTKYSMNIIFLIDIWIVSNVDIINKATNECSCTCLWFTYVFILKSGIPGS